MAAPGSSKILQEAVWRGSVPLEIRLSAADCRSFDQSDPYLVQFPRLSYLPFLFVRLHAFFSALLINPDAPLNNIWLSCDDVPLRWYHPVGLLYDLFVGPEMGSRRDETTAATPEAHLPWRLKVHFSGYPYDQLAQIDAASKAVHDAFINTVKEADFLRYGTAKGIMGLSKDDSTAFYQAVVDHDLASFSRVNNRLVPAQGSSSGGGGGGGGGSSQPLKNIPIRFYLPASPRGDDDRQAGHLKIIQGPVAPTAPGTGRPQTLGQALHAMMPSLFPSSRTFILAKPVLHGAVVPLGAVLEDLLRSCAYSDGWLHVSVEMMG